MASKFVALNARWGSAKTRRKRVETSSHCFLMAGSARILSSTVSMRDFGECRHPSDHGLCLLMCGVDDGFTAIDEAEFCTERTQPTADFGEALLLANRPAQAVAHERARHPNDVQSAVCGEAKRIAVEAAAFVIEGRFLRPALRQDRDQAPGLLERTPAIIQRHILAMAGQRDIGQVLIQGQRCQHLDPVDGRSLRLMHRRRVAVVDIAIEALIDLDAAAALALPNLGDQALSITVALFAGF
ncbi:hypothetical protein ABIB95_009578 [Bradyrhizobium sp. LA2.1]